MMSVEDVGDVKPVIFPNDLADYCQVKHLLLAPTQLTQSVNVHTNPCLNSSPFQRLNCDTKFSWWGRGRHHCKCCGAVLCKYHSYRSCQVLPASLFLGWVSLAVRSLIYKTLLHWNSNRSLCSSNEAPLAYLNMEPRRVCDFCFDNLKKSESCFFNHCMYWKFRGAPRPDYFRNEDINRSFCSLLSQDTRITQIWSPSANPPKFLKASKLNERQTPNYMQRQNRTHPAGINRVCASLSSR